MAQSSTMESPSVSPDLLAKAEAALLEFRSSCFWFRHPEATTETIEDIRLIIRHLREYGGRKAWYRAQDLLKCL